MSTKIFQFCVVVMVCFVFVSNCLADSNDVPYAEGRLLVKFAPKFASIQKDVTERNSVLSKHNLGRIKRSLNLIEGLNLVELPNDVNVPKALLKLKNDPNILYAEPDWKLKLGSREPNDPIFEHQWAFKNTGESLHEGVAGLYVQGTPDADIDAPEAWDVNTTSNIIVALIDSGIDYTHPDLAANIWTNAQGYHGYDFVNNDNYPMDDNYHGTHVAGIIGAVGNNGIGVSGVCWNVKMMALKVFDSNMVGYSSDAIEAIDYARNNGAKIINASWGWYSTQTNYLTDSNALKEAIQLANANGILCVTMADNRGYNIDSTPFYPASYSREDCPNIIAAMATNNTDSVASMPNWSNYGPNSVDIAAPGVEIYSTMPSFVTNGMWYYDSQGHHVHLPTDYYLLDGTSLSAAFVSGACALVWTELKKEFPDSNYLDVKDTILNSAEKLPVLTGKCRTEGRLNLHYAITGTQPFPYARNITKATNHETIQEAVNNADTNDVIVLDKGTYYEHVTISNKNLTIRSLYPDIPSVVQNTLIDGANGVGDTIRFTSQSGYDILNLDGLSLLTDQYGLYLNFANSYLKRCNISATSYSGTCVFIYGHSNADIDSCTIDGGKFNSTGININDGWDVIIRNSQIKDCNNFGVLAEEANSVRIYNNKISGSSSSSYGYGFGIYLGDSDFSNIYDNIIYKNRRGIQADYQRSANIRNNTVVYNATHGIYFNSTDNTIITNCILWGNDTQIFPSTKNNVTYSCIKDGFSNGSDIINPASPIFVDTSIDNYHLKYGSPCIDSGNPAFEPSADEIDIDGDKRKLDGNADGTKRVDMGADEYRSGDFNDDGIVNFKDYAPLAKIWRQSWSGTNPNNAFDINGDHTIDYNDIDIFASFWLTTNSGGLLEGQQMQQMEIGLDELLLDGFGDPNIFLVYEGNEPNIGQQVTVLVQTNTPLYIFELYATVTGDANITGTMNINDCNQFGWEPSWGIEPYVDDANGWLYMGGIAWPSEANNTIGYFTFVYNGGEVSVTIDDLAASCASDFENLTYSIDPLIFGRDPNE